MKTVARTTIAGALLCVTSAMATQASAATITRNHFSHAAANCQSALPVFDGNIRKRPKALANEGTSNAFITCAFEATPGDLGAITTVRIMLENRADASQTVNCTLVDGFQRTTFSQSNTKSVSVAAANTDFIMWTAANDNNNSGFTLPALSCNLLPGVEISGTSMSFREEIGS